MRDARGVEAIVDAAKRWPKTPIIQLYAATFWLYGQTDSAREAAGAHLRACKALTMNGRRALHGALALWHGNENLRAVVTLEAITAERHYVLGQQQFRAPVSRAHAAP
jgi:hypothetical protein